jgi:nicotinamide-nucleotide amidase
VHEFKFDTKVRILSLGAGACSLTEFNIRNNDYFCIMNTEIINIGDELLIGQVVNTNGSWMAEQLNLAGFRVYRMTLVQDVEEHILASLQEAGTRADLVLITGGLGPTKDDITKNALCRFFNTHLVFDQGTFDFIEKFFAARGYKITETNRKQAEIPESCTPVPNNNGTAPGMIFRKKRSIGRGEVMYISMPGVPFEMKAMMTDRVIPFLKKSFPVKVIRHKTLLTQGVGESFLSDLLEPWETKLPPNIRLAYLPQPGIVRLRLTCSGDDEAMVGMQVEKEVSVMQKLIPEYIYGYDDDTLEQITGRLLMEKKNTLATAESCTGGYIAHLVTSVPGSSNYYKGSVVAYSNDIKVRQLGVDPEILEKYGAVSEQVVRAMAAGIRQRFGTDYAIATSGIAGPDGGTPEKPVGTSWIAIATPGGITASRLLFGDNRERNIRRTAVQALNMLRKAILSGG